MNIFYTEDVKVQMQIGKQILEEKTSLYNESLLAHIRGIISENMPDAETEEKEKMLYRSIYDYWAYGNNVEEEFYYGFYKKNHEEKQKYLNAKNHILYANHLNDVNDTWRLHKYEAYKELKEFYKRDIVYIDENNFDVFSEFVDKHPEFVVKPNGLGLATGVYKISVRELGGGKKAAFMQILNRANEMKGKFQKIHYSNNIRSGAVLEEIIDQVDELNIMHPSSVNGIRCTTICVDGKVNIYYPWFKIGTNGKFVTGEAFGDLMAGINAETGIVETLGYNEKAESFEYHPTTGVKIPGFRIPKWNELIEMLRVIGKHFPTINYIGWDMALSKKGWCIMEGNTGGEALWQLVYGRGMKDDMEKLIGWRPEKEFWWE